MIRLDLTDERFFRRRRAAWILLVAFLLAVIGFAIWTIFATTRWWGLKVFGQLEPRVLGVERDIPRSAAW